MRAEVYASGKLDKNLEDKCFKVTKKCVVAESLAFDDCQTCLFVAKTIYREQILSENKKHKVGMVNKHEIALNRDDDKRFV